MAQDNTATQDVAPAPAGKPFTGLRYLVDATGERQYAVNFKNGLPVQPLRAFSAFEGDDAFKPNEKVFAFEEGATVTSTPSGGLVVRGNAYQISISSTGRPNNIKTVSVEYDAVFKQGQATSTVFTLRPSSATALRETGFSEDFPKELSGEISRAANDAEQTASGLFLPSRDISMGLAFPPQHPQGAELAREGVKNAPEAETGERYKMADEQTLVETKQIGGGERLKLIFNFEAARVDEVYTVPGQQPAMTGHHFSEHDAEALKTAFDKLEELGGKPKPLAHKPALRPPAPPS